MIGRLHLKNIYNCIKGYKHKEDFMNKDKLITGLRESHYRLTGKSLEDGNNEEIYLALGNFIKEELGQRLAQSEKLYKEKSNRSVYYISMEFLTGTFLKQNLEYLGFYELVDESFYELGFDLEQVLEVEDDPGLGNGGLGRLAAAFLDSMVSLKLPGFGYGLRYEKGLFEQRIENFRQIEYPDDWLKTSNVWEFKRPSDEVEVKLGGRIDITGAGDKLTFHHVEYERIRAIPYDIPYVGYRNDRVNSLRLWSAESYEGLDFREFARGNYHQAFLKENRAKSLVQFLYPEDSNMEGKRLRLEQEYFLVSASMQDLVKSYVKRGLKLEEFHKYHTVHINDTHPALAIPELIRIFVDEYHMPWNTAWDITEKIFAFTNHTILQEAMERWEVGLFKKVLPRIWMIIEELNYRYLHELENERNIDSENMLNHLSILEHNQIKMVNLAIMGSYSVNGVAELHTNIIKENTLKDLYNVYPEKFNNKTNGIVHRRWLLSSNKELSMWIENLIGEEFKDDPMKLKDLMEYKEDESKLKELAQIKHNNKVRLADYIWKTQKVKINPHSIFDIQIKRIHEYKRQLLNILHIIYLYEELKKNPNKDMIPRTFIFGGKAAPGYFLAKEIIKLIVAVANTINNDVTIKDKLKVVFVENYNVSKAEILIPAADISEQISTATKEASGTGNMKFMMNGAITIGTLDGANVEIRQEVGDENFILFGLRSEEVHDYENGRKKYNSRKVYENNPKLKAVLAKLVDKSQLTNYESFPDIYKTLVDYNDRYFVLTDFEEYRLAHEQIDKIYRDEIAFNKMSLMNIANSGIFSSDRTIRQYASEIWNIKPVE